MKHERVPVTKPVQRNDRKTSQRKGIRSAEFVDNRPPLLQLRSMLDNSPRQSQQKAMVDWMQSNSHEGVQRKETDEPLTGASPLKEEDEDEHGHRQAPAQTKTAAASESAPKTTHQTANRTGLPDSLKAGVESMSGMDMSHVRVHYNSPKPALLQAHAYAQGSDIHVAPGQEHHVPHEAWHVVQQAQGRVKATTQMKGAVPVNDDARLEQEADVMGERAMHYGADLVQRQASGPDYGRGLAVVGPSSVTVQKTKLKNTLGTVGGATALGLAGAGIGSVVPGIGTAVGGVVGAVVGGIAGYFASKPTVYANSHKGNYGSELRKFQAYQLQQQNAVSAYERGTIIRYSPATSLAFNELLHEGNMLYTYDKNSVLSIGSNVGEIKHAIVAGDESVKAAGHANVKRTEANINYGLAIDYQEKIDRFTLVRDTHQDVVADVCSRFAPMPLQNLANQAISDEERASVQQYRTALDQIEYWQDQLANLDVDRQQMIVTKANEVMLDNESGHYHPGASSKNEAFEGWRNAGYSSLSWKSHGD